ncbi:amino acid adenylation domain-containing protein [Streptomyces sp. NPDC056244]|uniref:non-ribosomal peptide synthetase n=1 Tax=Streptomyces sp. NPDC056244 TaxID=3345762 RepID=UPI0035D5DC3E
MSPRELIHASAVTSFQQQRLWFLSQMPGASTAYNEAMAFELRGPLDREALARALDALVARHEALRTRLVSEEGEVRQLIGPPDTGFALETDDLTGPAGAGEHVEGRAEDLVGRRAEDRIAELRLAELTTPFDLAEGPLGRGRLIVLGAGHHILLLTMHHSVYDGQSMDVMLRELGALYTALARGTGDPLPPLPLQYAEYAAEQRRRAAGEAPAAQAAYWQEQLAGVPSLLELPTDRPRPPEQDHRGGRVSFSLDEELTARLAGVARRQGGTLFVAVLAGWAVVLSRLTGRTDIVVGTPAANRRRSEVRKLIGFFVNSLALRVDLSGSPSSAVLLKRVRGVVRGALDHQDLPFERVVELVNPPRSAAHTPVFQTMCAWVPDRKGLLDLPDIAAEPLAIPHAAAKFDLALSLSETDGRIEGQLDYATALFDHGTAERYAGYLRQVLAGMAEDPDRPVDDLDLMGAEERRWLLADWNGLAEHGSSPSPEGESPSPSPSPASESPSPQSEGPRPQPQSPGLVERFEEQVRIRPAAPALVAGKQHLDYAALDRRANRLAHALIARGVRPDQVVGLHTGRSLELVVGILGILKAGAAYLPLDPGQPAERLAVIVEDSAPALVLTDAATDTAPDADPGASPEDTDTPRGWHALTAVEEEGQADHSPAVPTPPSRLAYVIHTSGSTGRPKGVAVTHASVLNLFDSWRALMGDEPGEAHSAWSSIGFDASVHEILMPLTTGGTLHLVPDELRGDPEALMGWLREHRVVQAFLPPSYIKWIDEAPEERLRGLALRQVLTGVESLPETALYRMCRALPGLRIRYGYGPTEATLYSTAYTAPQPLDRPCPIGRPLDGTRLYLLDERLRPVPAGVTGEVYLGGASLARGYLHRPDLTAERFVANPFVPGERMYRTGDLARRLPDGNAEYAGRSDDQIKLRGFRIEPGEIEAALLALPGVREAAVLADRDPAGQPRLVAGIGHDDAGPRGPRGPHEWRAALAKRLPDYMIPAVFVELPSLPLTHSGKLDRAALLRRIGANGPAGPAQVNQASPRDHIELTLYQIWRDILLHPDIGIGDSFFDLGGTSLSAIKMAHAVRESLGAPLAVRDILLHPTIEALGGLLRHGAPDRPESSLIEFRAGEGRGRVVCVHPAGGTAFCYLSLAKALPESLGLYGIQSPGLNPDEAFLPSVDAMAEAYLRLIEPLPAGPLVLTGLSYGGLVAHEMGRRLALGGRNDVSVVLLDTQASDDPADRAAVAPVDMAEFRDKLVRFNGMYPGIDDAQIERYFHVYNHNRMTARDHQPLPSPARLVLVQAVEGAEDKPFHRAVREFWRRRAEGGFAVEPVDCDHWELLESGESVRVAALIEKELGRVGAGARPRAEARAGASSVAVDERGAPDERAAVGERAAADERPAVRFEGREA